jgi:hypothetical protein
VLVKLALLGLLLYPPMMPVLRLKKVRLAEAILPVLGLVALVAGLVLMSWDLVMGIREVLWMFRYLV